MATPGTWNVHVDASQARPGNKEIQYWEVQVATAVGTNEDPPTATNIVKQATAIYLKKAPWTPISEKKCGRLHRKTRIFMRILPWTGILFDEVLFLLLFLCFFRYTKKSSINLKHCIAVKRICR